MILKKVALAVGLIVGCFTTTAMADIQISDTYIDFKGDKDFSVTLLNTGASIDTYKLDVIDWKQKDGFIKDDGEVHPIENVYEESSGGLSVFPKTMVLRQGQTNTVRLRVVDDMAKTKNSYRLVLQEIDKKYPGNKESGSQILLKFSHRIPVFVNENDKNIKNQKIETALVKKHGKNYLRIKNLDSQPLFINEVKQDHKEGKALGYIFNNVQTFIDLSEFDLKKPIILKDRYDSREVLLTEK